MKINVELISDMSLPRYFVQNYMGSHLRNHFVIRETFLLGKQRKDQYD